MADDVVQIVIQGQDQLSRPAQQASKALGGLDAASKDASKSLGQSLTGALSQAAKNVDGLGNKITIASGLIVGALTAISTTATKWAMDAVESNNLAKVSFGEMYDAAVEWSEGLRTQLGLNDVELRRQSGMFNTMFGSMKIGKEASFDMATGLTQLAYDFASFYNLRPDEAFDKLRAGIMGETEPLRALGIVVNETTTKQWALTNGLIKQGDELSDAQKVLARYGLIMEATSQAQGDLARTIDSPTNKFRVLQEQVHTLGIQLGEKFLPLASKVLGILSDELVPRVEQAIRTLPAAWAEMSESSKRAILFTAALLVAGGPLLKGISFAIGGVALLANAFTLLAKTSVGKIGLIGASLAVLGDYIRMVLFEGIGEAISKTGDALNRAFSGFGAAPGVLGQLARTMTNAAAQMAFAGESLRTSMGTAAPFVIPKMLELGEAASDLAEDGFDKLTESIEKFGRAELAKLVDEIDRLILYTPPERAPFQDSQTEAAMRYGDAGKVVKAAWAGVPSTLGKAKEKASELGMSLADLVNALIAVHPAALAAAAAVSALQAAISITELAISANNDQIRAAEEELKRLSNAYEQAQESLRQMQDHLSELNQALSEQKQRLSDLANIQLAGMGAFDEQIAAIERQLKRLRLMEIQLPEFKLPEISDIKKQYAGLVRTITQGGTTFTVYGISTEEAQAKLDEIKKKQEEQLAGLKQKLLDEVMKQFPEMTEEMKKYLATLPSTREGLEKMLEQLRLMKDLQYDEALKKLREAAEGAKKELTFEEALRQIEETKQKIADLTGAIGEQEAAIWLQQAAVDAAKAAMEAQREIIEALQRAGDLLNLTLQQQQKDLAEAEAKQKLVNDALALAYDWYINDREKVLAMGAAGVEVAATMDEKTKALLLSIDQAATDTTATSSAALATLVSNYQRDMATAISRVADLRGELDAIPRNIETIHTTVHRDVYEGGDTEAASDGNEGTPSTLSAGGSLSYRQMAAGDSNEGVPGGRYGLNFLRDMTTAISQVGRLWGALDAIPRNIETIHTTVHRDVYEGGDRGTAGNGDEGTPGGRYGLNFLVGGSGGPDSQLVRFMATPGERVMAIPPGQPGNTGFDYDKLAAAIVRAQGRKDRNISQTINNYGPAPDAGMSYLSLRARAR